MAYKYPTEEGIKFAMEQGWSKEQAERGFEIFDFDGLGIYEIEVIGDCYPDCGYCDDEEAAREAERIGYCKIIPAEEIPETFILNDYPRNYYGWIDTPENRKKIKENSDYYAKQEEKQMINFDPKISGVRVTGSEIDEVMHNIIFPSQFISLKDCIRKIHRQESMNWLLDTLRFSKGEYAGDWCAIIDWDSIAKLTILEKYPEVEKQFIEYFGEDWMNIYIRFNH